eukprot:1015892-Prymnesium_polylepis.1
MGDRHALDRLIHITYRDERTGAGLRGHLTLQCGVQSWVSKAYCTGTPDLEYTPYYWLCTTSAYARVLKSGPIPRAWDSYVGVKFRSETGNADTRSTRHKDKRSGNGGQATPHNRIRTQRTHARALVGVK